MAENPLSWPLMISVEQVHQALETDMISALILVDVAKAERFEQAHLPNAQLVQISETQRGAPIPGLIPSDDSLNRVLQAIGYREDAQLVIYDDEGGGWAGRLIWILDELGITNYSYLDGGLPAWQAKGYATESGGFSATANSDFQAKTASGQFSVQLSELLEQAGGESICVWDARSYPEHTGEKAFSARGGRIPGACHYEWTDAMNKDAALVLKPLETLKRELADKGIDGTKPIVTHCQTHHRSGLTYLIGKLLGYPIKAYPGSWSEWGNQADTPVETGPAN